MKATSKREAQRNASPLVTKKYFEQSTESAKYDVNYSALSELHGHLRCLPGATRLTLFGACPWLSYSAPLALSVPSYSAPLALSVLHIPRLWRCHSFIFRALALKGRLGLSGWRCRRRGCRRICLPCRSDLRSPLEC